VIDAITGCFPNPPEVAWDTSKPSGQPVRLMDTNRAAQMLGFKAQTPFKEGVRETVEWYMANAGNDAKRYDVFTQKSYLE
jgi:nucleoside-diphosphate-sugar epimerase